MRAAAASRGASERHGPARAGSRAPAFTADGLLRVALVCGALATGVGGASEMKGHVAVSTVVHARVLLEQVSQPARLDVSASDVDRGYVDAPAPDRLVVSNTDPRGFAIDVWPVSRVFAGASLIGGDAVADVGRDGGTIVARGLHGAALPLTLRWRFVLAPDLPPGTYAWPVQYAVHALWGER